MMRPIYAYTSLLFSVTYPILHSVTLSLAQIQHRQISTYVSTYKKMYASCYDKKKAKKKSIESRSNVRPEKKSVRMRNKDLQNETNTRRVYFHPLSMSDGNLGPTGLKSSSHFFKRFSR